MMSTGIVEEAAVNRTREAGLLAVVAVAVLIAVAGTVSKSGRMPLSTVIHSCGAGARAAVMCPCAVCGAGAGPR